MTTDQRQALITLMGRLWPRCRARGGTLADTITMAAAIAAQELRVPLEDATRAARTAAAPRTHP